MAEYNAGRVLGNAVSWRLSLEVMCSREIVERLFYADLLVLTVGHRDLVCAGSWKFGCGCDIRMRFSSGSGEKDRGCEHEPCPRSAIGGNRPRRKPVFLSRGGPLSSRYPEAGSNQAGPHRHTGAMRCVRHQHIVCGKGCSPTLFKTAGALANAPYSGGCAG